MELIDIEKWCEACYTEPAEKLLIASGRVILGWYCDPCGAIVKERTTERVKERTTKSITERTTERIMERTTERILARYKFRARCHFNENSNRQCLLDDQHGGDHNLPCSQSSAHQPHNKESADAYGALYRCGGQRFDSTLIRTTLDKGPCWFRNRFGAITIYNFQRCADDPDCQRCSALAMTGGNA